MNKEDASAQLQDVFYSIGGGSQYMRCDGMQESEVAVAVYSPTYALSEMDIITDGYPTGGHRPRLLGMPWYRRLWDFLNMDVRDIWRLIVRKVK